MKLSEYNSSDIEEINKLFIKTFSDSEGKEEGDIIGNLTNDLMTNTGSVDLYCFVATESDKIIAGVFFSRLTFESNIDAFMLAPMATLTEYQGKGIGQKLINFGHNTLKKNGVSVVVTYGDINFYSRVGYKQIAEDVIKAPLALSMPEGWLGQSLISDKLEAIDDKPSCVEEFNKPELW